MVNIDKSKCIGCSLCVNDCIANNITLSDGKAHVNGPCILCGHCVAICPENAVYIPEYDMADVEEYDRNLFGFDINNLLHTIKFRRSIRQFEDKPVERDKMENILQAGRYTATGSNRQDCRFIMVSDGLCEFKDIIWKHLENTDESSDIGKAFKNFVNMKKDGVDYLFRDAKAVIYISAKSTVDAALAAQNMELAAIAQGLGILYNGFLVYAAKGNSEARKWLDTEDTPVAVCMLVGYPRVTYQRTAPRKTADVRWR
jgi:nitroreductase/NAD-dependent dihydropyrimidine dehydrogenase PreA subunit